MVADSLTLHEACSHSAGNARLIGGRTVCGRGNAGVVSGTQLRLDPSGLPRVYGDTAFDVGLAGHMYIRNGACPPEKRSVEILTKYNGTNLISKK